FTLNPVGAFCRLKPYCTFDAEPPFPVVCCGEREVSVRTLVRNFALALTSGPFAPAMCKPATDPGHESCKKGAGCDREAMARAREYLIAAEVYTHMGFHAEACEYY